MNTDVEQNLSTLASKADFLIRKKELNNFQGTLEILWQGINLYHLKMIQGQEFTEEDRKIMNENYLAFKAFIEPII